MEKLKLLNGNNIELLKKLESNSVDSIITDPPYGLSFMNKKWDYDVPSIDFWKEVLRVLKPGGHVLSFGGTRTYHRMVINMEDAGFEIRDQIMWLYGSGFPKSHNISKAIDKFEGNERKIIGKKIQRVDGTTRNLQSNGGFMKENIITKKSDGYINIEEAGSENSKKYDGWGTALKPANEPICLARKPLEGNTIAENVLKYETGGINIDSCRVGTETISVHNAPKGTFAGGEEDRGSDTNSYREHEGRFPANIILECICDEVIKDEKISNHTNGGNKEGAIFGNGKGLGDHNSNIYVNEKGDIHTNPDCPCRILDEQSGINKSVGPLEYDYDDAPNQNNQTKLTKNIKSGVHYSDKGGASRFFYQAKVSKKERNMGLDAFEDKLQAAAEFRPNHMDKALKGEDGNPYGRYTPTKNTHPTVKPIQLMAYLCRLITPPNGTILDPFMGSGSTGISALLEGFNFIGMELDENYFKIAEERINNYEEYRQFLKK